MPFSRGVWPFQVGPGTRRHSVAKPELARHLCLGSQCLPISLHRCTDHLCSLVVDRPAHSVQRAPGRETFFSRTPATSLLREVQRVQGTVCMRQTLPDFSRGLLVSTHTHTHTYIHTHTHTQPMSSNIFPFSQVSARIPPKCPIQIQTSHPVRGRVFRIPPPHSEWLFHSNASNSTKDQATHPPTFHTHTPVSLHTHKHVPF